MDKLPNITDHKQVRKILEQEKKNIRQIPKDGEPFPQTLEPVQNKPNDKAEKPSVPDQQPVEQPV